MAYRTGTRLIVALLLGIISTAHPRAMAAEPDFGPNVVIFDPSDTTIQEKVTAVFAEQEKAQFGLRRVAFLFKPGEYKLDAQIGFYTHVIGLGRSPDGVAISGAVRSMAKWMNGNATCNFWRAVENVSITPAASKANVWAVSQGTWMRRTHIKGDINLWDGGWSSGGFLADCKVDGAITSGSQQQWISRNCQFGKWNGGVWNMVFVGVQNPPEGAWPQKPYTVIEKTPLIREKPYLFVDEGGRYFVNVPDLQTGGSQGVSWSADPTPGKAIPIDDFYIARADKDTAATINAALARGKHLLLTPGIYHLDASLSITRAGTVVLGIGYATLIPDKGTAAITIADVDGVKVGGILIDAGGSPSKTLLQIGDPGTQGRSHAGDPIFIYDIVCRAGGAQVGMVDCFVTIDASNVVGDNFWLWRADHGEGAGWTTNKNKNGLIVNGNDVTIYGLFVEHTQEYQTLWNGEGGRVYFYQSEIPYDPPSAEAWRSDASGVTGYASYKVSDKVTTHEAWGLGVYSFFRDSPIIMDNAIETPDSPGIQMHHLVAIRLNGKPNSGIRHIINGKGESVIDKQKAVAD